MKRVLFIAFLILCGMFISNLALAQVEWYPANQRTIEWDEVIELSDGNPIPDGSEIGYYIYTKNEDGTNIQKIGETAETRFTITTEHEGRLFVGVRTVRKVGGEVVSESAEINWSDVNGASTPNPFGIVFYIPPKQAGNLRPVQ